MDNLVMLCGEHHRALHDGVFAIETLRRQRFRFRDSGGVVIDYAPGLRGKAADLADDVAAYTLVDGHTLTPDWYGDRLTRYGLGVIVDNYVLNRRQDDRSVDPWAVAA